MAPQPRFSSVLPSTSTLGFGAAMATAAKKVKKTAENFMLAGSLICSGIVLLTEAAMMTADSICFGADIGRDLYTFLERSPLPILSSKGETHAFCCLSSVIIAVRVTALGRSAEGEIITVLIATTMLLLGG